MPQYIIFLPLVVLLAIFVANIKNKGLNILSAIISFVLSIAFGIYLSLKMHFFGDLSPLTYILVCSASIFFLAYISITPLLRK